MEACEGNNKDRDHLIEQELKWSSYRTDAKGTGKGKEPCPNVSRWKASRTGQEQQAALVGITRRDT
jgi:hypothetical protein